MRIRHITAGLLFTALLPSTYAAVKTTVAVEQGQLRGQTSGDVTTFLGIPYAAAPIGPLRWRAPVPAPQWKGVRDAKRFGAVCVQPDGSDLPVAQSEDCLNLNIWRPAGRGSGLPVMVWIHGGAFSGGANAMPIYDGSEFARRGVVLVTINYRLGLLGFFAHPALLAEPHEEGTGNFGVMDAIAALRWVRTNIAAFGGDPRNVTVFGESAGGQMVNALMTSPQASGLFQRAISQSAFNRVQWRTMRGTEGDTAERIGIEFARSQGIQGSDAQAAQALRALPAQRVGGIRIGGGTSGTLPLALPMVDGRVLTEQVLDAFTAGRAAKVPFITGSNGWEASLVPSVAKRPENTLAALGAVRGRVEKAYAGASLADMALDVKTDVSSTEPVRQFARLHAANGQKAFAYHFSYLPKSQRDSLHGTPHGGEIAYVFGNLGDREVRFYDVVHPPATPQDRAISEAAITYWTNFARTGEPGSVAGVAWPTIGADDAFLEFGPETFSLRPHFRQRRLDALERAPQRVRLPADD